MNPVAPRVPVLATRWPGVTLPRLVDELDRTRRTRVLVEELIADPAQLGPDRQPVRRLTDDAVVGWKATGRGKPGTELADTLALLHEAVAWAWSSDWTGRSAATSSSG